MSDKNLNIRNKGTRQIVIGPPAKSLGSKRLAIKFGTKDDDKVPKDRRIPNSRVFEGAAAEELRSNRVLKEVGEKVGLQMSHG